MDVAQGQKEVDQKTDCTAPHAVTHAAEDRARLPLEGSAARNLRHGQHKGGGKGTDASLVPMARRSKLAPFKKLALTLKSHWDGILNGFDSALNNGSVEAINGLIQAAKARARGYRKPRNLMLMAYLIAAKLSHLPTSPYTTTYGDIIK